MEDSLDFQIDFETISSMPVVLEEAIPQQKDCPKEAASCSNRKGFGCDVPGCGKVFKFRSELTRHNVIHQNDRPHCCTYRGCTKTFKRVNALENHLRSHHRAGLGDRNAASNALNHQPQDLYKKGSKRTPKSPQNFPWEERLESPGQETQNETASETFKAMLQQVLDENRMLKQQLKQYTNAINFSEEKYSYESQSDNNLYQFNQLDEFTSSPDGDNWL